MFVKNQYTLHLQEATENNFFLWELKLEMVNRSLYFKDKLHNFELKSICESVVFSESLTIAEIIEDSKYFVDVTLNTITIIPLYRCTNIHSTNSKDKVNEKGNAIFCDYKLDTVLSFNLTSKNQEEGVGV